MELGIPQSKSLLIVVMVTKDPVVRMRVHDQALQFYSKGFIQFVSFVFLRIMKQGRDMMGGYNRLPFEGTMQFLTDEIKGALMQFVEISYCKFAAAIGDEPEVI